MVGCALCGRNPTSSSSQGVTASSSSRRCMQDRLPVSEGGFTYLHAVLNILTAAECYDGELAVDGVLCDSCADSLEQLEQLQNQVRDLVEFLVTGYQQRRRYDESLLLPAAEEEEAAAQPSNVVIFGRIKQEQPSPRKKSLSLTDGAANDDDNVVDEDNAVEDSKDGLALSLEAAQVGPPNGDIEAGDCIKKDLKNEEDGEDSGPPMVECVTQLTVRRGRRGRPGISRYSDRVPRRGGGGRRGRPRRVDTGTGDTPPPVRRKRGPPRFKANSFLARCDLCGEAFASGLSLLRHIEKQHGEEEAVKVTTCDICHYRLKTKRMLARHKYKVHGVEVPFACPACNLLLRSEAEYTRHMRQNHMETAVCELCGKECYSKYQLGFHTKQLHGDQTERYICEVCSQVCKGKGSLRVHMRRHSTVNAVQCQLCERSFKWESSLVSHIQAAHNVTGPTFPCDLCERVFKDKNNQKKHRFTHTTVKPYQCDDCGKGFIRRDFFTKHRCSGHIPQ